MARERADPENSHDDHLLSTGCQNVPLQRGAAKVVMLGKSQLEGCGYGLFTAEDVAQDEFVIEYTGELITHDEGVRREARRGDVFDEESTSSYLFTLLEHEGIWVDAAIYGNLSRYINHASEHDRKGCNITPKIMYVNGEYRIKFSALRDIKAGEELFFNYGDYFPNLTKKLLEQDEDKPGQAGDAKRKSAAQRDTARKTTAKGNAAAPKSRTKKLALEAASSQEDDTMDWMTEVVPGDDDDDMADEWAEREPRRRKKRGGRRPGAGRKKKVVTEEGNAVRPAFTEIGDSQGENSPTNMSHRGQGVEPTIGAIVGGPKSAPAPASGASPPKKVSKRGGARPGAGRKPKHPKPGVAPKVDIKPTVTTNSNDPPPDIGKSCPSDSDVVPLLSPALSGRNRGVEPTASNANATAGGAISIGDVQPAIEVGLSAAATAAAVGRKRKVNEVDQVDDPTVIYTEVGRGVAANTVYPFRQDQFQPVDDDEDDDDTGERHSRKRQKPLRYRLDLVE